ncbi:MAG: hypothetical protein K9G09_04280 [Pontimonas sp.]|nr:hypothetical protein [Pontimonas sp.]
MLPGPLWVKVFELLVLAVAVVALLMAFVFPVIADLVFVEESTLGE